MTQIICIDRGLEHPKPVVTIQGEKPSTLNVMREAALGGAQKKEPGGLPIGSVIKAWSKE